MGAFRPDSRQWENTPALWPEAVIFFRPFSFFEIFSSKNSQKGVYSKLYSVIEDPVHASRIILCTHNEDMI